MQLTYEIAGEGEPLVLLNGIMMTVRSWASQTQALSARYRCVLHDFRGQLRNPVPGPFAMSEHVDDLAELLDRLEIGSAHIVGTSYGGEVGMMFALAHPERVRSLSAIACASHVEPPLAEAVTLWRDVAREAPEKLYEISAPYNYAPSVLTLDFVEQGKERLRRCPPDFFTNLADLCDAFLALDITDRLDEIHCPTLVICGERDALKPISYSRTIASGIAGAKLHVIEGAGHAVALERPDAVNALLIRFLASASV
jgi:3-oxoadipate enol-lactonase